jgi:DNA primase
MNEYRNSLEKLGYSLQDCGSHWRTRAIFRNGKTSTSLIIYKDSGVWRDFGGDEQAKPFAALVKETLKTEDPKALKEYLIKNPDQKEFSTTKEEVIEMEKIYPESYLDKLLPMKTFYEKRGISSEVQSKFKCGYAGGGKMYRRMVFPIYDLDNQIHGFSGRSVTDDERVPKWKHMGRKSGWVYPHQLSSPAIEEAGEVILVESIGDCLALYENGFENVLVTFGLDASPKMISYLNSFNLNRIIIATNNDQDKESNSGGIAAIKTAAKLSQVFDFSLIRINPPLSNDFGDMALEGKDFKEWHERSDKWKMNDAAFQKWVLNKINSIEKLKKNTHCQKLIKILNGS